MLERIPERWVDVGVALAVALLSVPAALRLDGRDPLVVGPPVVAIAALVLRRSRPLLVLAVITMAHVLALSAGSGDVIAATVVAFYGAGAYSTRNASLPVAALGAAAALAVVLLDDSDRAYSSVASVVVIAAAWLVGDNARVRREREEERARGAVADERARIARELHDVVTHNVSVMVVQAAAGNDVFDSRPDRAREALAAVEDTGRRALGELRTLLDVVADDTPQPGLARLAELLQDVRQAGVEVALSVEGSPRELPAAVDVSAFRIVQESLTNTLKHAKAACVTVCVRYGSDGVELEIADDGVSAASTDRGRGLAGMRERAWLLGGTFAAGRQAGGGFVVRAQLPVKQS